MNLTEVYPIDSRFSSLINVENAFLIDIRSFFSHLSIHLLPINRLYRCY